MAERGGSKMVVRFKLTWLAVTLALLTMGGNPDVSAEVGQRPEAAHSLYGEYLASRFALRRYDYERGLAHLNRALEYEPDNLLLKSHTAFLQASLGDVASAAAVSRELQLSRASNALTPLILMSEAVRQNDFQLAAQHADSLDPFGVGLVMRPILRAWALTGQGKADEAIALLQGEEAAGIAQTPLVYYHTAMMHELAGRLEMAESFYLKALSSGESKAQRIVEATGSFYERHRGAGAARAFYEDLLAESRDNWFAREGLDNLAHGLKARPAVATAAEGVAEVLFNSAGIVYNNDDVDEALFLASLCLYVKPDFANAHMMKAALLEEVGRLEQSRAAYLDVPRGSAFYWRAQVEQALTLHKMGRAPQAIEALTALTAARPESYDPYVNRGDLQKAGGQFREAAASYTMAIEKAGELKSWHWPLFYARGIVYERSGDWGQAEADLMQALTLAPGQPEVLNYLAYSWVERDKNLPQAKAMLAKAMDAKSEDASILDSYGWVHFKLGDAHKAVYYLEQAIELMPSDAVVSDHLGDAYWAVGRTREARFQWARTLTLDPDPALTASVEDKIAHGLAATPPALADAEDMARRAVNMVDQATPPGTPAH